MATFLTDTFTGIGTTSNLASHTGETGATWTKVGAADFKGDNAGHIHKTTGADDDWYYDYASGVPAGANYDVTCGIVTNTGTLGCMARGSTSTLSGYAACYDLVTLDGGSAGIVLYKFSGGLIGSVTLGRFATTLSAGAHTIVLSVSGTSLSVSLDGTPRISASDSTYAAAGKVGVFGYSTSAGNTDFTFDSISAADAVAVSTSDPAFTPAGRRGSRGLVIRGARRR